MSAVPATVNPFAGAVTAPKVAASNALAAASQQRDSEVIIAFDLEPRRLESTQRVAETLGVATLQFLAQPHLMRAHVVGEVFARDSLTFAQPGIDPQPLTLGLLEPTPALHAIEPLSPLNRRTAARCALCMLQRLHQCRAEA